MTTTRPHTRRYIRAIGAGIDATPPRRRVRFHAPSIIALASLAAWGVVIYVALIVCT